MSNIPNSREFFVELANLTTDLESLMIKYGIDPFLAADLKLQIANLVVRASSFAAYNLTNDQG
jgi:hypothetical protein